MFARGEFEIGQKRGPVAAAERGAAARRLQLRAAVGPDPKVQQVKVSTGRRWADRVEITGGAERNARAWSPPAAASSATATWCVVDAAPACGAEDRVEVRSASHGDQRLGLVDPQPDPAILLFVMLTLAGLIGFRR